MLLAWALLRLKRFEEAEAHYRYIIERHPKGLDAPLNLAESLVAQGKASEAVAILQVQALREPYNPHVLFLLANAYVEVAQFQDALATFRRVVNLDPTDHEALINLAATLNELGHWEDGLAVSRSALKRRKHPLAARNVANALAGLKRWDEAVEACRTTLVLDQGSPEARMDLAMTLIESGCLDEGMEILETMASHTSDPRVLARLSYAQRKAGDAASAAKTAEEALKLRPSSAEAHGAYGWALFELKQWSESARSFRAALTSSPKDVNAMLGLAASLSSLGDHAAALEWFARALAEFPACLDDDAELRDLFRMTFRSSAICRRAVAGSLRSPSSHHRNVWVSSSSRMSLRPGGQLSRR
jgi:protein O-GlcNAc transferase